jgi:hypothetical protein
MSFQHRFLQGLGVEKRARSPSLRRSLLLCAMAVGLAAFSGRAGAADCTDTATEKLTPLSTCFPNDDVDITIGAPDARAQCKRVYLDKSSRRFRRITINADGALCVRDADVASMPGRSLELTAGEIIVNGTFQVGSADAAIGSSNPANHVEIVFSSGADKTPDDNRDVNKCSDTKFRKGLQLCQGGVLRLFGKKGAPADGKARLEPAQGSSPSKVSWTYLKEPAGDPCRFGANSGAGSPVTETCNSAAQGGKTVKLADPVDWQVGDWIVIATTSFSPFETEFSRISEIDATRTIVTLQDPLVYYHFGGPDPGLPSKDNLNAGMETNWGVDERAEVGLISRNVTLSASITGADDHWGGETIFLQGFKEASVQGVEFALLGKPQLGSYPIHFHMDGLIDSTKQKVLLNANSIHHSFNKCITVHSTQNLKIQNNVCARAVGHLFYEEIGDEEDITFAYNLGLGAMSNNFGIRPPDPIARHWWPGDRMVGSEKSRVPAGYNALNVENHDNQANPTHGVCATALEPTGKFALGPTPCTPDKYFEPASGFWIINPGTKLIGNSIGGCQGVGRAYWYVPPKHNPNMSELLNNLQFKPIGEFGIGEFKNNRAHGCYAGLYTENAEIISEQLFPHVGGKPEGASVFNVIDGITITRMRDRGIWVRPSFWVVKNARLATNRHSVSLVTAGGVDGTAPGNWALLEDSVLVGISRNNVDRFGPCPYKGTYGVHTGGEAGCIDVTPYKVGDKPGGDFIGKGYPDPKWNFLGLMIYDGPGRYFRNRFVNFNRDISLYLMPDDGAYLGWYHQTEKNPQADDPVGSFIYEGDAAIGWFQANQSSYPNTQASEGLIFDNVDFRHQIYTERVGVDSFHDGDKNTLILDRDGSLTGMKVVGEDGKSPVGNIFPASLNNLPFNATYNSVDECLSTGRQNDLLEGRPTSLIAPGSLATLEFSALFPERSGRYEQLLTFSKTTMEGYPAPAGSLHGQMTLHGRNGLGIWEPKVSDGYGYIITATSAYPKTAPANAVGIPPVFNLGLTDAVLAFDPKTHQVQPFRVRVGVCFTDNNGEHPQPKSNSDLEKMFKITRGYKSYGSPTHNAATLSKYWNEIKDCHNLDQQNPGNLKTCPAKGVAVDGKCPDGQKPVGQACPTMELKFASDRVVQDDVWHYENGVLYFTLIQHLDNGWPGDPASNPSPTGSCDKSDPPAECPNASKVPENYYVCPAGGCIVYRVELNADVLSKPYTPGKSNCGSLSHPPPGNKYQLADSTGTVLKRVRRVGRTDAKSADGAFPHYAMEEDESKGVTDAKMCPTNGTSLPPWGAVWLHRQSFQVSHDPSFGIEVRETNRPEVRPVSYVSDRGNLILAALEPGKSYTITVSFGNRSCTATFEPDGVPSLPHFKKTGGGGCMPAEGDRLISASLP